MMGHDSTGNDSEFMALTLTRALAVNYHAKISTTSFRTGKVWFIYFCLMRKLQNISLHHLILVFSFLFSVGEYPK